jgi:hypothetical protein
VNYKNLEYIQIVLCTITITSFTQRLGLSSAIPSINIVYKKAVVMKATKQVRGYSHEYQDGAPEHESEVRNKVPAIRNSACRDKTMIRTLKQ